MKTTEEKAKAYDEALKQAKNIKSKILQSHLSTESCKAVSEYIDEIIPELRESNDERIRKKCMDFIRKWSSKEDRDECLAYLEKQKEPLFDFALVKQAWYMEGYKDREFGKESRWIIKTGEGGPEYEENPKYGQPLAKEHEFLDSIESEKPTQYGLEEEIHNYLKIHHLHIKDGGRVVFDNDDSPNFMCDVRDIAGHFAQWGAEHFKK